MVGEIEPKSYFLCNSCVSSCSHGERNCDSFIEKAEENRPKTWYQAAKEFENAKIALAGELLEVLKIKRLVVLFANLKSRFCIWITNKIL